MGTHQIRELFLDFGLTSFVGLADLGLRAFFPLWVFGAQGYLLRSSSLQVL